MIEIMANRIVNYIDKYNDRKHVSRPVMLFALQSILANSLTILLSLIIGLWLNKFTEVCMVLASMALFRNLTGGIHFTSPTICVIVSTSIVVIIPFIPINETVGIVLTAISMLLVFLFAPADLKGKTRISDKGLKIMKIVAVLLVCTNFVIQSGLLSLTFFLMSITLIPLKGGQKYA